MQSFRHAFSQPSNLLVFFTKAAIESRLLIPFFGSVVQAGFPSPVENYVERACDLNDLCITNQEATYFVRALGDSMEGDGIREGDVLVVDCSPMERAHVWTRKNQLSQALRDNFLPRINDHRRM